MYYLALLWDASDSQRNQAARALLQRYRARSPGWQLTVNRAGMAVLCTLPVQSGDDEVYVLSGQQGVVFGRLFDRSYVERAEIGVAPTDVRLDEPRSKRIIASKGQELIDQYWGQYVAFLRDSSSAAAWVVRDPTGGVPCQSTQVLGVDVYFVRLQDCEKLGSIKFSINRHFLLGYLFFSGRCVWETGLNEVETVLPGERVEHQSENRNRMFLWNPLEIAKHDIIEDVDQAVRLTRMTVKACVHAWASRFDSILLSLSGGLDSSIVLACLTDAPTSPRIVGRNLFGRGPNADERRYARLSADRAGIDLIEEAVETNFNMKLESDVALSPFPVSWPYDRDGIRKEYAFIESLKVSALFNGDGGDEIFLRGCSIPGAVDFAWLHGLRPAVWDLALKDATLDRLSVWRLLRLVYFYGVRKNPRHMRFSVDMTHMPLMNLELKRQIRRDLSHWHPLYTGVADLPPGKFEHAYLLTFGSSGAIYVPIGADGPAPSISPLLSQPLLELSLRTPLYVLRTGGRDRAIARRAFSSDIPREIALRRSKVFGNAEFREVFVRNIALARELLLDGFLVREGILDKSKLEEVLSGRASPLQSEITELCDYLSIETWIQSHNGTLLQATA